MIIKDEKVNLKKRCKYCSVCAEWIPFQTWKKHQQTHENFVSNSPGFAAEPTWYEQKLEMQRKKIEELESNNKALQSKLYKFNVEREQANTVLKAVGNLLVAQHSEF